MDGEQLWRLLRGVLIVSVIVSVLAAAAMTWLAWMGSARG